LVIGKYDLRGHKIKLLSLFVQFLLEWKSILYYSRKSTFKMVSLHWHELLSLLIKL